MDPSQTAAHVIEYLQRGVESLVADIQREPAWRMLTSPGTPAADVRAVMKEIYAEIAAYQPDVIEATIAVIGQFPRSLNPKQVRAMLVHQAEEWDHGEMAARDFVGLGGRELDVRSGRMTPTSFATAAFWRMLAHKRMPFAYLGAIYLFEGLTPLVTGIIKGHLKGHGFRDTALEYIEFHSTEDIRHAKVIDAMIRGVVTQYPQRVDEVKFGFDAFRQVYPLPGWRAAAERAQARRPAQVA
ncbi:MAG TPA: iron-containing redox enzyme family protein [Vicinamibacterales bacterium]